MKDAKHYKVKTQQGYVIWTLIVYGFGINGNAKVEYDFINNYDFSDSFDYQDACAIAFDLNKQNNSLDFAVIETEETV
jgi:hypothetical protein